MTMQMPDIDRPPVSFILLAYNQERFIREAVKGALAQSYCNLEVIISDDRSTDGTWQIINDLIVSYRGPHKVITRQNYRNLGLTEHFNNVLKVCCGDIIVIAAGDDISLPERVNHAVDMFALNPEATAVLCSAEIVNDATEVISSKVLSPRGRRDNRQNMIDLLKRRYVTFGAGRSIRREVFDQFGPFDLNCPTEDTPLLLRSLLLGSNVVSRDKHVYYRKHTQNLSGPSIVANLNIDAIHRQYRTDVARAMELNIISARTAGKIENWIKSDGSIRAMKSSLQAGENISYALLMRIIKDRRLSSYTKVRIIVRFSIARVRSWIDG